jgi:transglutaminase-like putative cysteine protease
MQSVSLSTRIQLAPGKAWNRARSSTKDGLLWSALIVFLLALTIARSTAAAGWTPGIDVIPSIALGGALLMAVLALSPVPWPAGLGVGMLLSPVVAAFAAWPVIHARWPQEALDPQLIGTWWTRITDGSAGLEPSVYLVLICWLMWITGAWLSWCVLRWRKPMLGLIPGAAAFATNLLNFPRDQNGYTLAVLVLILALLLWTNYTTSIASANRAQVKLTGDARWDFWESGLVAMAALIVLAILLPPLSTMDRTTDVGSTLLSNWAELQLRLNHPGVLGGGTGGGGTTGFVTDVPLNGALTRTKETVFTYQLVGAFTGPKYFRGVNATSTANGEWRYPIGPQIDLRTAVHKNQNMVYTEDYLKLALGGFQVRMQRPPNLNASVLFYPGDLYRVDREAVATQVLTRDQLITQLTAIDRLDSVQPATSAGNYAVTVEYSVATEADLQGAGTGYPDWVQPYMSLPAGGYRTPQVMQAIHDLALSIVKDAGATNPYDIATAIQNYLRTHYTYDLAAQNVGPGPDRLANFLFESKRGYCEYFASAMGDMLRSLGIPTRLVNGFGPGSLDNQTHQYVVRGEDAHTWVESYFPKYGWIPFEPTPDTNSGYVTIPRGSQGQTPCLRASNCDPGGTAPPIVGGLVPSPTPRGPRDPNVVTQTQSGFGFRAPDAGTVTEIVGVLLAVVLLIFAAAARYLRPRSVMGVWKRMLALSGLAGLKLGPGDTPLELGRRMQKTFPEASEPAGALAGAFVVAAYAPPDLAGSVRSSVMEAWTELRPLLLRRVLSRLRRIRTS